MNGTNEWDGSVALIHFGLLSVLSVSFGQRTTLNKFRCAPLYRSEWKTLSPCAGTSFCMSCMYSSAVVSILARPEKTLARCRRTRRESMQWPQQSNAVATSQCNKIYSVLFTFSSCKGTKILINFLCHLPLCEKFARSVRRSSVAPHTPTLLAHCSRFRLHFSIEMSNPSTFLASNCAN